jgi:hypothetical protein
LTPPPGRKPYHAVRDDPRGLRRDGRGIFSGKSVWRLPAVGWNLTGPRNEHGALTMPKCAAMQVRQWREQMCRNIKTLFNFEPPATEDEIQASALQFVRKLSGFNKPSQANEAAFDRAVAEVSASARRLLVSLHTHAPARDREIEAEKARERSKLRFG